MPKTKKPNPDKAAPGSVVVAETSSSTWNYHLRRVAEDGKLYLGGGAPPAICGRALGWDTRIPVEAWGSKSHIPQHWCIECAKVAGEELMRASILPALDIMKKGLKSEGWVSTTSLGKTSINGRSLHRTAIEAARHATEDLGAWEDVILKPGSEFYVGEALKASSFVNGSFMEVWTVNGLTRYVIGRDGKPQRQSRPKK